jgi:hypothetical protein
VCINMSKNLFFLKILVFFLFLTNTVFGQLNDKKAFSKLKKLVGIWKTQENNENIYEIWTLQDKNSLQIRRYKIEMPNVQSSQNQDTIQLMKATINYSRFVRFVHISSIHYNINASEGDSVYPFRLEKHENNVFEFSNFNNPSPNKIIYEFTNPDKLLVKSISNYMSYKTKIETFDYQKVKK